MMLQSDDVRSPGQPVLRIQLLGEFRVSSGDRGIEESGWRLRNAARLMKLLALAPGHTLHREQIIDELWPDLDLQAASNNLRYTVHVARRTLRTIAQHDILQRRDEHVMFFPVGAVEVDADRFQSLARKAKRSGEPATYRRALRLYSGDLLPGDRYEDWAAGRRETLRATYLTLLVELARLCESADDRAGAIAALQRIVAHDSVHEDAHVGLMRLYAAEGQRQNALRQYRSLQTSLRSELDADPEPASQRLYQEILTGPSCDVADRGSLPQPDVQPAPAPARRHNLPFALTSFVGRDREIAQLQNALKSARSITLIGAGGSGKTRLAMELARRVLDAYPDGVWLVDLAPLGDPGLVPETVAETLGVPEDQHRTVIESIVDALTDRMTLILLDNCEHVVDACAEISNALLQRCPGISILATSRERLNIDGERIWQVRPLTVPDPQQALSAGDLARIESVQLFCERAALVQPDFSIKDENAGAISRICRRLDGMPLAIELAASRVGVLSPEQLAVRLDDALGVLIDGSRGKRARHQTLRAMLDWSYDLLSESERTLLRRLSVFAGGWTLDDAESVCAGGGVDQSDVLPLLAQLVYKSLVVVGGGQDEARYRLLEVVRQYAAERLERSGEPEMVQRSHALRYLAIAETAEPQLSGPEQAIWLERLETERDNLRVALLWAQRADPEVALRLAAALGRYWWARGYYSEGRAILLSVLEHLDPWIAPEARVRALTAAFLVIYRQGDYATARVLCEENLRLQRELQDRRGVATTLGFLAMVVGELGDLQGSRELVEESLGLCEALDDKPGMARGHNSLGEIARIQGDLPRADCHYQRSVQLWREIGDRQYIAIVLHNLGYLANAQGDRQRAAARFRESLKLDHELGNLDGVASCLAGLAAVAVSSHEHARAARLLGAADTLHRTIGTPEDTADQLEVERCIAEICATLGEAAFNEAWSQGSRLPTEQAIAEALEEGSAAPGHLTDIQLLGLSTRERQVVELVATGLTNRDIASALGIASRTVDTHVGHILRKLGLISREQVRERWQAIAKPGHDSHDGRS
jgi:predicted ATPase/DNA-binding SARP family transcriptional activator/DNA-binding NarL/FixJ family response regulator